MLAQDGVLSFGEAERVLQLRAAGQQLGDAAAQVQGLRREAARPAHDALRAFEGAHHRVIRPHIDVAVMGEEPVGHAGEAKPSFRVRYHDGLLAEVAAGHHQQGIGRAGKKQVMQRRIGQHDADGAVAGSYLVG